jgi:hypothetical protein
VSRYQQQPRVGRPREPRWYRGGVHGLERVVRTLAAPFALVETRDVHIREEGAMRTTVDEQRARMRSVVVVFAI